MDANRETCAKCGEPLKAGAEGLPYCETCRVRLGFIPFSLCTVVEPNAATYYAKQLAEEILREWCYLTAGGQIKDDAEFDGAEVWAFDGKRTNRRTRAERDDNLEMRVRVRANSLFRHEPSKNGKH